MQYLLCTQTVARLLQPCEYSVQGVHILVFMAIRYCSKYFTSSYGECSYSYKLEGVAIKLEKECKTSSYID